eukprot:gene29134-18446_t
MPPPPMPRPPMPPALPPTRQGYAATVRCDVPRCDVGAVAVVPVAGHLH